jgi:hypothetical protein
MRVGFRESVRMSIWMTGTDFEAPTTESAVETAKREL